MEIELIGVPFDGYGRTGQQAAASTVLRGTGLVEAFGPHHVTDTGDVDLPAPSTGRGASTGLINEAALLAMIGAVRLRVTGALAAGRFPVLYGGDCASLLGTAPALRDVPGGVGLLFVDGHEDTMPLDVSEDGEAANTEIGLLLGLTGGLVTGPLRDSIATLSADAIAVLGPRDQDWRRRFNVGSLRECGVWARDCTEVAADPGAVARAAVAHLRNTGERWWMHVDLDVLDPREFGAQGLPGVPDEPGGLTVGELTTLLTAAADAGGCAGLSVGIYDPDQDPDRHDARQVVELVTAVAAHLA